MRAYILITLALGILATACEPEDRPAFRAEVCLQLHHHGLTPADATAYVAPASDFPGYGAAMDARFAEREEMRPNGRVCFGGLEVGPHWFAAEGWDEFIRDSVRGSKFLEITTRDDFYDVEMEVSEQH